MDKFIRYITAASLWAIFISILPFGNAAAQTTIGFSISNATVTEKDTFTVAVNADSLLTGKNIYSYRFSLTFDANYLEFLSIDSTSTILKTWGTPVYNNKYTGKLLIAGAGVSPLSGSGEFFYLKFRAIRGGGSYIDNNSSESYLNEGSPLLTVKRSYIQINSRSYPDIYPDSQTLFVGDEHQMNVYGGTAPYVYSTVDTAVIVITDQNKIKAKGPGLSKVFVTDNAGEVSYTSGNIDVRAIKLSIVHSTAWPNDTFYIPVRIEIAPGTKVLSGSFELVFDSNIKGIKESVIPGDFPVSLQNNATTNLVKVSFASGSALTGTGILCYIRFKAINSGMHFVNIQNALFNENLQTLNYYEYAEIYSLPTLNITPNSGTMMWGSTEKITVTNGTPPITFETTDTNVATIDALGNLTSKTGGKVRVKATDSHGATQTSGEFLIYHNQFVVTNTDGVLDKDTRVPITTSELPPGTALYSFEGTVTYDPAYLDFVRIDPGSPGTIVEFVKNNSTLNIVGASGSGINAGAVCYLIFRIKNTLGLDQQTNVTMTNFIANESGYYSSLTSGKVKRVAQVSYRPVAVAGPNSKVNEGTVVTLDGSASYDDDNDPITYSWISPPGIQLNDSTLAEPNFTAPLVNVNTNLVFTLIVNDGKADSDPSTVTITVMQINQIPFANAGPDRSYPEGSTVSLDGGSSNDPDGESVSFKWTSLDGIILFDPTSATPSFIAPQVNVDTEYKFKLIVSDGFVFSKPDTVSIRILQINKKPVAFAGGDQTVSEGAVVYLDGSLSSDPDGNNITLLWTAPANIVLSSTTDPKPFFTAPAVYRDSVVNISLVVNDGTLNSDVDNVAITIKNVDILSTESQITNVELLSADSISIDQASSQVIMYMPYGFDIRSLSPTFKISDKATISPQSGTVHNFTSPVSYTVTAEDGLTKKTYAVKVYSPDINLSRMLNAGWNWISLGVEPAKTGLSDLFGGLSLANLDYLKSTTASSVYYPATGWFGDLVSFPKSEMVKFKKATSQVLTVSGKEINPTLTFIPLFTGWNRIGYLLKGNSAITSSFDETTLPSGELLLKSKEASAVYYPGTGWIGDLDSMKVLTGYMLKSTTNGNVRYNAAGTKIKSAQTTATLFTRKELYSKYHLTPSEFENSANLISEVVNSQDENIIEKGDLLIAYIDGETRGVTEARYVPDLDRYLFFMTIFSNSSKDISFQLKSLTNKSGIPITENFVFTSDQVLGTSGKPVQLHLSKIIGSTSGATGLSINVYPNPADDHLYIDSETTIKKISIYNSLGSCIQILSNVSGNLTYINTEAFASGVYFLRIETSDGVEVRKFLKSME